MSIIAINARNQPEEIRAAILAPCKNKKLEVSNLYIENTLEETSLKNIYAGIIRTVEPSVGAAFVEYGPGRHGFLPFKEIAPEYWKGGDPQNLKQGLKVGQSIIVQVKKEERDNKGAALTTYIALPGTYLVLKPNQPSAGGISKQISGNTRKLIQQIMSQLEIPPNMGVIFRTAVRGMNHLEEIKTELTLLHRQWEAIKNAFKEKKAPFLIFQEGDILARTIRDYVKDNVAEVIVDDPTVFERAKDYAEKIRPDIVNKLRLYDSRMPLFLQLDIEDTVESAFQRTVRLPSGGSIVFGRSEACITIDINSGSSTKHEDIHETALKTNLEAAEVIATQLRLRDFGGLIVIDFIGMKEESHKRQVELKLWESTQDDRARIQMSHILPRFDVLVMSRQRLRPSLGKANESACPTCQGNGVLRSIPSLALSVIRAVEKKLFLKKVGQIRIEASIKLATYLTNEKRALLHQLEKEHDFSLVIVPNPYWEVSQYKIHSFTQEEIDTSETNTAASYSFLEDTSKETEIERKENKVVAVPAVERFGKAIRPVQAITHKLSFVKTVFDKLSAWSKRVSQVDHATPNPENKETSKKKRTGDSVRSTIPISKVKTSPRSLHTDNKLAFTEKPKSESIPAAESKQTKRYPKYNAKKKTIQATGNSIKQQDKSTPELPTIEKTTLQLMPKKVIYRYGGEPPIQSRSYQFAYNN
jgi:ribonuclease E